MTLDEAETAIAAIAGCNGVYIDTKRGNPPRVRIDVVDLTAAQLRQIADVLDAYAKGGEG